MSNQAKNNEQIPSGQTAQNYENHVNMPKSWMIFQVLILLAFILAIVGLCAKIETGNIFAALSITVLSFSSLSFFFIIRRYCVKLQDRIIRMEMRDRLRTVLPSDMQSVIPALSLTRLIALRFASDEEMPSLVKKVVEEKIESGKEIKEMIQDWQGDYYRI